MALNQTVLHDFKNSIEDDHLDERVYQISPTPHYEILQLS